jgi:hypothetical protein
MDLNQKLESSMMLHEEWLTRIWLCPGWHLVYPEFNNKNSNISQIEMAKKLAELPHFDIIGDIDYCTKKIQDVDTNQIKNI